MSEEQWKFRAFRTMAFGLVLTAIGVAAVSQTQPLRSPEKRVAKQSGSLGAQESTASKEDKTSPANVAVIVKQEQPTSKKSYENQTQEEENTRIQRRLANLTVGLVVVGFLQAVILAFTVRAIVKQTKEVKDGQRAWLLVDVEHDSEKWNDRQGHIIRGSGTEGKTTGFFGVVVFRNEGNSPGWIDETRAKFELLDVLPDKPSQEEAEVIQVGPEPIGVGRAVPSKLKIPWMPIAQGHQGYEKIPVIYGIARYRDIFGERHETVFGFRITPSGDFIRLENKPEYNKMT